MTNSAQSHRLLLLALAATALTGCLFPKKGAAPGPLSTAELQTAQQRWEGTTAEALEQGRQDYLANCDSCHSYPDLAHYPESEWPQIMERMGDKADLSEEQTERVLRFILTARKGE